MKVIFFLKHSFGIHVMKLENFHLYLIYRTLLLQPTGVASFDDGTL